jgi:hypothetical protein
MDPQDIPLDEKEMVELSALLKGNKALPKSVLEIIDKYEYEDLGDGRVRIQTPGVITWLDDGVIHREGGPAIVRRPTGRRGNGFTTFAGARTTGSEEWRRHGRLHREDGPAIENVGGPNYWFLYGESYNRPGRGKDEWQREVAKLKKERELKEHFRKYL